MAEFDSEVTPDRKVTELIANAELQGNWVSIEFFPPKTEVGVKSLKKVIDTLRLYRPLFADFTWGAGGSTSELTVELCDRSKNEHYVPAVMHLTCTNMEQSTIDVALEKCRVAGIRNIFALRGDPPAGQDEWKAADNSLTCALDLVRHIRSLYGDLFCLGVAGYPEGHPTKMSVVDGGVDSLTDSERGRYSLDVDEEGKEVVLVCRDADFEGELDYLKSKVDAGADYIITQMFFDVEVFATFVRRCRERGITVPILPGIMCISNYGGFKRMTKFCKTRVPASLSEGLEAIKDNESAVKEFGFEKGVEMCRALLDLGMGRGLHLYTLNTSAQSVRILDALGYPRITTEEFLAGVARSGVTSEST